MASQLLIPASLTKILEVPFVFALYKEAQHVREPHMFVSNTSRARTRASFDLRLLECGLLDYFLEPRIWCLIHCSSQKLKTLSANFTFFVMQSWFVNPGLLVFELSSSRSCPSLT